MTFAKRKRENDNDRKTKVAACGVYQCKQPNALLKGECNLLQPGDQTWALVDGVCAVFPDLATCTTACAAYPA